MFNLGTDFGTFPAGLKPCQAGIYLEGYGSHHVKKMGTLLTSGLNFNVIGWRVYYFSLYHVCIKHTNNYL